ncbi:MULTISPECIES: SDR family NAD(P)-dependent oxidoreductase [unclassified Streptomyces]|uniref:SDR family NAD(P)-dependent oxidoreductase n=1 Tax=unclassified Streptomyces TaxID=2593676 RepID=UPI000684B31C
MVSRSVDGRPALHRPAGGVPLTGTGAPGRRPRAVPVGGTECVPSRPPRVRSAAADRLGGLGVLLNVAGIHRTTPVERLTAADTELLFRVNAVGTALFCREALPPLPDGSRVSYYGGVRGPFSTAEPEQIAGVIAFAASRDAGYLSGAEIRAEGGSHI